MMEALLPEPVEEKKEFSLKQQYKDLLANKSYNLMTLSVSCMVSVCFIILTLMSELLVPHGYTDHEASQMGFWGNLVGVAGGIVCAFVITKTDRYKLTSSILIVGTLLGCIGWQLAVTQLEKDSGYWITFTCLMIICGLNMGLQSYCLEYAVYLAPEIGEAISGGTVCQVFNIFAFVQL